MRHNPSYSEVTQAWISMAYSHILLIVSCVVHVKTQQAGSWKFGKNFIRSSRQVSAVQLSGKWMIHRRKVFFFFFLRYWEFFDVVGGTIGGFLGGSSIIHAFKHLRICLLYSRYGTAAQRCLSRMREEDDVLAACLSLCMCSCLYVWCVCVCLCCLC